MLKRYFFNWTPSDVAAWEKIRARGFWRFILWWGLEVFGGGLFILIGAFYLIKWLLNGAGDASVLGWQLLIASAACLLGGVVNALITWAMEEGIYQRILKRASGK